MSKLLKSHAVGLPEIKNQQGRKFDKTCRVRICICKESKKIEKVMMREVVTSRKSKTHNRQWKTRIWGVERAPLLWSAPGRISVATPLRPCTVTHKQSPQSVPYLMKNFNSHLIVLKDLTNLCNFNTFLTNAFLSASTWNLSCAEAYEG